MAQNGRGVVPLTASLSTDFDTAFPLRVLRAFAVIFNRTASPKEMLSH